MNIEIKKAKKSDLKWINSCYDQVNFIHSNFDTEFLAIAKVDLKNAGVGRLVVIDERTYELGGIYVTEEFRNLGVAAKIVNFLVEYSNNKTTYCIPFKHLENFYKKFGFEECTSTIDIPEQIKEKFAFCKNEYNEPVVLLIKKPTS